MHMGVIIRQSGRHWLRRALELPESMQSEVEMCPADKLARKVVKTLHELQGVDFIKCVVAIHGDAYGQEQRIEVAALPSPTEAATRAEQLRLEEERLLAGGK